MFGCGRETILDDRRPIQMSGSGREVLTDVR